MPRDPMRSPDGFLGRGKLLLGRRGVGLVLAGVAQRLEQLVHRTTLSRPDTDAAGPP
jgi:hypothetical protein